MLDVFNQVKCAMPLGYQGRQRDCNLPNHFITFCCAWLTKLWKNKMKCKEIWLSLQIQYYFRKKKKVNVFLAVSQVFAFSCVNSRVGNKFPKFLFGSNLNVTQWVQCVELRAANRIRLEWLSWFCCFMDLDRVYHSLQCYLRSPCKDLFLLLK